MSKVTTIYDQVLTVLAILYPAGSGYTRIANPYDLSDNIEQTLAQGWGMKTGSASPRDSQFNQFTNTRIFTIVLSRQVIKLESDPVPIDIATKEMLEDIFTGQKDFFNNDQIDIPNDIEAVDLGPQSEVQYIDKGTEKFISMEFDLLIQFTEDL